MSAMAMLRHVLTAIVMSVALPVAAAPCAGFTDVNDTDPFCPSVAWIKSRGITLGCAANLYCPDVAVSRLAMAAFLNRLGDVVLPPNVIWVAPVGGQFHSIQAAIDYVFVNGKTPAVIKVAPGTYDELVTLRPFVRIEGSGKQLTTIQPTGCASPTSSAVLMAGSSQIQDITIVTDSCSNAIMFNSPPAVVITHVNSAVRDVDIVMNPGGPATGVRITGMIGAVGPIERIRMYLMGSPNYGVFADASNAKMSFADIDVNLGSPGDTGVKLVGTLVATHLARIMVRLNPGANSFGLDADNAYVQIRDSILTGATAIRSVSSTVQAAYVGLGGPNSGSGIVCVFSYNANTMTPIVC